MDGALSQGQLRRWYGLEVSELVEHFPVVGVSLTPTFGARLRRKVWVVCREQGVIQLHQLAHTLGVAELRHLLGARPDQWQVAGADRPDAIWQRDGHQLAVEYDYGAYSPRALIEKVAAYTRGYDGQVWGVSGQLRQQGVERVLAGRGKVWVAAWHRG